MNADFELVIMLAILFSVQIMSALIQRRKTKVLGPEKKVKSEISKRSGTDYSQLSREMDKIYYQRARYHPTRWYTAASNYCGKYVTTDEYGFRIDRRKVSKGATKILFLGGSTMFSTTTRDEGAIPEIISQQLKNDKATALNYGIGGYSTYAEIGAFCEALRREENVRIAVFYDGVNEIAMYLEMIQNSSSEMSYYLHAGYPFMSVIKVAIENFCAENRMKQIKQLGRVMATRQSCAENGISLLPCELFKHAFAIASAYATNVRVVAGIAREFDVKPIFIWQPDIFTTGKHLTPWEESVISNYPGYMRDLTLKVKNLVLRSSLLADFDVIDGTGWIDELDGDHFFDYCHVSEEANYVIATKIESILRNYVASDCWV